MKEFTITVTSDRAGDSNPWESLSMPPAGPSLTNTIQQQPTQKKDARISAITLTAHLTDVEYEEAQALLEKKKEDVKKA
jgi:hypothetical protein